MSKHKPATPLPWNNEQRGWIKRTLTCGHAINVTFKKKAHYCESCRARRRPITSADEE